MKPARDHLLVASEVALGLVTLTAIVGMHRLFLDGSYRGPLVAQAVVASVAVAVLRRVGVRLVPAAALTVVAAVLFISWTRFPETTRWLLPTPDTFTRAGDDLTASWRIFGDVRAPAPVENGFLAATAAAIWLLVFVADWAAFRAAATFEALLPATTLFVFAAALGGPGSPVASAAVFSGAALLYVLLHRTANQERSSRWAGGRRAQGRSSLVATGAAIIGVAVVAGTAAGPNLPGADAEALVAWRDLNQSEPTRVVLSPLVSMQTSLVEQSNVEVFTVRSTEASYWRLTALNEFDGEIWRSSYSTDEATGTLPRALDTEVEGDLVSQQVTIEALQAVWLPAAYEPVEFSGADDQPAVIDERSSTLMVDRANRDSDGYTYTVTSRFPELDADTLRTASAEVADDIAETYLQLPDDFSEQAAGLADDLTRDQPTPYDKARAIQDHLRTFAYDTNVPPGHSEDALVTFLFDTQRGYCEQFSAAFAALARSAGLPSRVAVGFTSGVQYPDDPTLFRVRGVHAHAWPEVYLGEYGWVPFEPTPGRGPPGAEDWLGIAPGQDTSFGGTAAGADAAAGAGDGAGGPTGLDVGDSQGLDPDSNLGATAQTAPNAGDDDESWAAKPVRQVARPVAVGTAAYLLVVPLALVGQRMLRRHRARTPAARARRMWTESVGSAIRAGVSLPPSLTIAEQADRMARSMPALAPAIQNLARTMEAIAYAEVPPTADEVDRAEASWAAIGAEASRRQSWWRRVLKYLDVRLLFAGRSERRVAQQGPAVNPAG
jgi:hypothetical protein